MRRVGIPPKMGDLEHQTVSVNNWFQTVSERMNVYKGTANPTATEVPENQWVVFYNTNLNEIRIWTNIAGTMKKSAAFT
jgi:hypothetical protein